MASEPPDRAVIRCAGDHVEVLDRRHPLHGRRGIIAFFVGDNVYVRFPGRRLGRTQMFFLDQLHAIPAPQEERRLVGAAGFLQRLRLSLNRIVR